MTADAQRLPGLDLIRGVAVMGIALMNVASFALPPAAYDCPLAYGTPSRLDWAVWGTEFVLVDGKLRALFSILFGASLMLVADRAEAAGRDPRAVHFRRMAWLLAIGLAHALLIWPGDILTMYALAGSAAWLFRDKPVSALLVAGLMCLLGQAIASAVTLADIAALRDAAARPTATAAHAAWSATRDVIAGSAAASDAAIALHGSGYPTVLTDRLAHAWAERIGQIDGAGLETIGFMLIGMAALRAGFFAGDWPRRRSLQIARISIGVSVLGGLALLVWCATQRFDPFALYGAALVGEAPLRPLLAIGYAGAILALPGTSALAAAIRAVGRMALSAYVGTSILFSLIFDGYGLSLFGRLSRAEQLFPTLMAWALMLLLCPLWLRHYRHGPLEWLWRSLAGGCVQPMRKAIAI